MTFYPPIDLPFVCIDLRGRWYMKHQQTFSKLLSNACRGVFAAYTCEVYTSDTDLAAIHGFRGLGFRV